MRLRHYLAVVVLSGLVAIPATGFADTYTYTYTGNSFNSFSAANTTFTTSDFVSGYFTTDAPLASNINSTVVGRAAQLTVTSYSFSDGFQTVSSTDPSFFALDIEVQTDALGNLIGWYLVFDRVPHGIAVATEDWFGLSDDQGQNPVGNATIDSGVNYGDPGSWTVTDTPDPSAVTPEPSSLALLGTGLVGLAGACRRRLMA